MLLEINKTYLFKKVIVKFIDGTKTGHTCHNFREDGLFAAALFYDGEREYIISKWFRSNYKITDIDALVQHAVKALQRKLPNATITEVLLDDEATITYNLSSMYRNFDGDIGISETEPDYYEIAINNIKGVAKLYKDVYIPDITMDKIALFAKECLAKDFGFKEAIFYGKRS